MNLKKKYSLLIVLVFLAFGGFVYSSLNVITALRSIDSAIKIIYDNYVNEVDITNLLDYAIEAMTDSLDTHTTFLRKRDYEDLRVHTEGEFGGLGIQISKRGDYITIISPIEGTPAYDVGLMQGDKITKIDGISTKDMKLDKGVSMMRGKPNTDVTITISRKGLDREVDFTITRAVIKIKSVPYAGMASEDVGFVVLSSFSRSTAGELRGALDSLIDVGAKKFIIDLRNNPGGILDGAAEVASFFIEDGKEIVYTEGRTESSHDSYDSRDGSYSKYPLVVLVSAFSASGSEIVAGAIQDWDRGFLIGSRTFGKGSVQRPYPLPGGRAIKLTIARYHTPSGRCIDKELVEDTTKVFHTRGKLHREVKGGGGIIPDSILKVKSSSFYEKIYSYGFDFIVDYLANHPNTETVTPNMIEAFKSRVKEELKKDSTKTIEYMANYPYLDNLTKEELKDMMKEFQKSVRELLKEDAEGRSAGFSEKEWNNSLDDIKRGLKVRLAYNKEGIKGRYEASISDDEYVQSALGILKGANTALDVFSKRKR